MAKRFTATEKWHDKWFRELPLKYKMFWVYLLDNCDNAGIIEIDLKPAEFYIDCKLNIDEINKLFEKRLYKINSDKWFIPKFIGFQYNSLNPAVKAHKSVIDKLNKYSLLNSDLSLIKDIDNSLLTVHRTVKDKDMDKDIDKDMVMVKDMDKDTVPDFDKVQEHWNIFAKENNLCQIVKMTKDRKAGILQRMKEPEFDWKNIFIAVKESDFLLGKKSDSWKVDFDFIFCSPKNYLKILEGKYKNNGMALGTIL